MARELSNAHTRMVFEGTVAAPATLKTEYCVKNGDLFEEPKNLQEDSPNFGSAMTTLWQGCVSNVKTEESLA